MKSTEKMGKISRKLLPGTGLKSSRFPADAEDQHNHFAKAAYHKAKVRALMKGLEMEDWHSHQLSHRHTS